MNKIYKVIYSKVRQCYVVVSEIAKSHGRHTHSSVAKTSSALTAAVLFALGAVSFTGVPVAQADGTQSLRNNDFVGANEYYWYFDEKTNKWTKYPYWGSDAFNNRSRQKVPNYLGGGAKEPGSFAGGLYAQAGQETITIGDRNAGQSRGSVFIGEQGKYNDGGDNKPSEESMYNNYVTAVGFQSDATGWGSIAIGSNAVAENTKETSQVVDYEGSAGTSGTVKDDNYGIKLKPEIKWSSVALGYNAHAKDGNIAIGADSEATDTSSATPYVSVGNSTLKRRITNVADGTGNNDVATVGQMNKAIESVGATGWTLSTNGKTGTAIKSGTTVDFSPAVDGKNGTADHSNVTVSNTDSNVKIGLNRNIVLGEATSGNGGSLNVYSDSTEASNLGNRVSIDGSTVSVNYGSEKGTSGTKRGVVLGVGEDYNNNAQGYIAFNNIDAKGTIGSTYLHSATDAPNDLKGRLVYSNAIDGTEYIANLDDGITFTGDVQKDVPKDYTQTPTKLNTTLNITGGAATEKGLTSGNIGVVSTPAAESADGMTQASKLEIKLNKDLKGITSITSQTTDGTTTSGATITLGTNGTTISGGDVNVSEHKVTGLANGDVSDTSTDAITGKQLYDAKNALTVKKGWGIKITDNGSDGKTIELERNLGKNYGVSSESNSKGKVEFEATGDNSLILGGSAIEDGWYSDLYPPTEGSRDLRYLNHAYGTFQADSVLVGGENNATGTKDEENPSREKGSVVVGGRYNTASGYYTLINGGSHNITNGDYSAILGGYKNEVQKSDWAGHNTIVGGAYNIASGTGATAVGGGDDIYSKYPIHNIASGSYSTTVGGKGNEASGKLSVTVGGEQNKADGWETVVIGGVNNEALSYYGNQSHNKQPFTEGAIVVGGQNNKNSGRNSSIFGGNSNLISISASTASIVGGTNNFASGDYTTVGGGQGNVVLGYNSAAFGGFQSIVNGSNSTGIAGGSTEMNANLSLAAGYQSTVTGDAIGREYLSVTEEKYKELMTEMKSGKMSGWYQYAGSSDGKYSVLHYKDISTALGYQATADESGTIALGHDKGDTFLTYKWQQKAWKDGNSYYTHNINTGGVKEISEEAYKKLQNSDGTWNDYTASPTAVTGTYDTAYYNRLVKAADGINAHDAVVMEQLKPYTKSDASNIGNNLKTYTVGDDGETITEADATDDQKKANENAWGAALGTGKVADPNATGETSAENNGSQQLVTGGTVFNETRISAKDDNGQAKTYNYLNANNSAGKNLEVLDSALKTVSTTAGAHTALTVEGNTPAGTGKDAKTNEDVYAGKNILLHESKDENGKVTYDLKLAKDINIGKPGKDGEDGQIGIDGKDGHIGLNGSDGISVRGLDGENGAPGKDGVTITGPQGEAGKDGINGKVGISGTDGKDAVSISGKDGVGHIGLTGPAGTNGMNGADGKPGTSIDITVKNGYDGKTGTDGKDGVKGEKGVDGTSLTRIVYTDGAGEHQVATMEDGMKYAGDDAQKDATKAIAKKLNNTLDIIGGADSKNLTESNIGVNSTTDGKLKVQLAKDLKGITSISNQKTEGDKTTGAKITLGADGNVDVNGGKITNVGSGIEKDGNGKYTVTDQNKYNAANVGDVQNIVNDAKKDLTEGANGLNKKANVDASNIGTNLKNADGSAASTDAQKANAEKWGSAIGTGKIEKDNGQLVTGKTVYDEVRPTADGSYVKKDKTTGENLSALDTQVKTNADNIAKNTESIQNITNNMQNLSENAVKYDGSDKSKVTLGGKDGTVITNVKDGALSENSKDAVNGKQLYNEQKAREAADKAITEKVTNNTNEITKIKNGDFTDASKTAIHNIAKDAVAVVNGKNTTVTKVEGTDTTPTTYAVNVEGTGKVAAGDTGLISGDTLYKEVHIDKDGAYIKGSQSVGQNLSNLDTGLKTTSDLIHTNAKGDTIQIGGNSTATKVDISGKDAKGNTTGRVITGVVSDVSDPNSAANVGYVNGITSASNEQIYHDMNMQYNHVENDISRAAAGSNALAALHPMQEFDPDDKAQFALGYGHYRNSNAGAVGAFYQPDENSMVNFGVSFGNGDAGINAGVTFKFGPGGSGHHALTKTQMAKVIDAQSKEIDELKKDNADKDKRIDALEQKMTEILAKLDKSKD